MNRKQRRAAGAKRPNHMPRTAPAQVDDRLRLALDNHQKGQIDAADRLYRSVLRDRPRNPAALHLYGVLMFQRGDLAAARRYIAAAIDVQPNFADALFNLGKVETEAGDLAAAVAAYEAVVRLQPTMLDAHYNLANARRDQGDLDGAVIAYRNALKVSPAAVHVLGNLGNVLRARGALDEARTTYQRALQLAPQNPLTHNNLSVTLRELGDVDGAVAAARRAIELRPDLADAHLNLGVALADQGSIAAAVAAYRAGLDAAPNHLALLDNLASALRDAGDLQGSLAVSRRAISTAPGFAPALVNIGLVARAQNRLDAAGQAFDQALAADPDSMAARLGRATILIDQARLGEAAAAVRHALDVNPRSTEAYYLLSELVRFEADDPAIGAMKQILEAGDLTSAQAIQLNYALAKALHHIGDYNQAFDRYRTGARRKRQTLIYDLAQDTERLDRIVSVFDQAVPTASSRAETDRAPIFIIGMPRSGSTLVEQILASHSRVAGGGELPVMLRLIDRMAGPGTAYPEAVRDLSAADLASLGDSARAALRAAVPGAPRVADKLLSNFQNVGLIHRIMPDAKIIWCRRDPLDTCLSCYRTLFRRGLSFSYDLDELGHYYRLYDRVMRHWIATLPDVIYPMDYEALVDDQEGQTRGLLAACDLAWEPQCLHFQTAERAVLTASAVQVRQPLYRGAIGQWRHYEAHLADLIAALGHLADGSGAATAN